MKKEQLIDYIINICKKTITIKFIFVVTVVVAKQP